MSRFAQRNDSDKEYFKGASTSSNTKISINTWVNVFNSWAQERGYAEKRLHEYLPTELDTILQTFYMEVRKQNGDEYEPQCLNVMITSLDRHLKNNGYEFSIVRDREFSTSKVILEGIKRDLRMRGKGRMVNRSRTLTCEEEETLWDQGAFGMHSPRSLLHTLWWFITQQVGIKGRAKHHQLRMEDFVIIREDGGREFVTFNEGITKNRSDGLHQRLRLVSPRMYARNDDRCPVAFFKLYREKRPVELRNYGPFYLATIDRPKDTKTWYKINPMGVNTIGSIMKGMLSRITSPVIDQSIDEKSDNLFVVNDVEVESHEPDEDNKISVVT